MFAPRVKHTKLKTNLRLCVQRLKVLEKKKTELATKARKEIADYIANGKEDRAKIRVEHIVREDYLVEAMEILELFCDLLLARFGLIETMTAIDDGLREAISSIIWGEVRLHGDIPEFHQVVNQFAAKYSKEFVEECRANSDGYVNEKLLVKLSVNKPPAILIERYMIEIARVYKVPYEPDPEVMLEAERKENAVNEEALIDFGFTGDKKNNFGGSGGGGCGFADPLPLPVPPMAPPSVPGSASAAYPPGAASGYPPPGASGYPPPAGANHQYPPYHNTNILTEHKVPPPLPNSPPNASMPPGHTGFGGGLPATGTASMPNPTVGVSSNLPDYSSHPRADKEDPPPYSSRPQSREMSVIPIDSSMPYQPNISSVAPAPPGVDTLPELPSVPGNSSFSTLDSSAGGEDVDFDDLTRRFEQLKKKK
ncbi:IST1 homolog isoform X2 [Tubulanus polymorphus]|uniref:IST1 homolog isoform X2 n=1 Tax=Tubulanus polymorphus TaxID=672921 RepID=UPI003DA27581